jgi:hypothetical protein
MKVLEFRASKDSAGTYVFKQPRELAGSDTDLRKVTDRIKAMTEGLSA